MENTRNMLLSLIQPGKTILFFDTETTGFSKSAKIIQFSGCIFRIEPNQKLKLMETFNYYMNPLEQLPEKIIELTGISDEMLLDMPDETIIAPEIFEKIACVDIWAAYNCGFDIRMMNQMADRTGYFYESRPCIDVLLMARECISKEESPNHNLQPITKYFYPDVNLRFHSAVDDVIATEMCFSKLIKFYNL